MAEKQLAYRTSGKEEFFADDDPLAELARIVGFEPRPTAPVAANQRQEPAFDLEDELLREFERYDAPRAEPTPVAQQQAAVQAQFAAEEPQPVVEEPPAAFIEQDWQQSQPPLTPQHDANVALWSAPEESWELPAEVEHVPAPASEPYAGTVPTVEARDLSDELEMSLANAPVEPVSAKTPQWAAASIRLPLANFNTARREPVAPAVSEAPSEPVFDIVPPAPVADFEAPAALGFPAEQDRHEMPVPEAALFAEPALDEPAVHEFDLVAAARDGHVETDAALTEPAYAPAYSASAIDIDDLLADVSRYPVPAREPGVKLEPAVAAPSAPAPVQQKTSFVEPQVVQQAAEPDIDDIDPFEGHEFDLDLAEIELELAQLDMVETKADEPVRAAAEQAVVSTPASEDWLAAAPAPVQAPAPAAASYRQPEPVTIERQPYIEPEQELPFDPSEISETEDRVETFEDMHVPALPPVEEIEPIAPAPDYDFDIDAEMANLFSPAAPEAPVEQAKAAPLGEIAVAQAAVAASRSAAFQKPAEGLDEFERALEEDFRRSFRETPLPHENASQMVFESSSITTDRWRARSMRGFAVAATAILVIGAGIYGVYGWMSHGSTLGFTSGEPRVIVADTDPVKVVPENPGGKIVPNQDKAVYDRVAGDSTQAPKQKELVTSDEQPVDVVQKTLIPEAVSPDDSEGDPNAGAPTPVGETEDPRLLPGQGNTQTAAVQDNGPSVSPRKVRTMIVKPDGTLVPRDDDPTATATTQKPTPALAAPTKPANSNAVAQMASATPAPAATDAPSAESAPIRVVKTTSLGDAPAGAATTAPAAPVPAARPTAPAAPAKPVVAEKPPVAPKPAQVASANPAPQPPKATPAPAAAASGGYGMQIASLPSEEEAKRSQANMTAKFGSVLGGHPMEVRKVDIPGKGTYYRVRVPVGSKDDAAALCVKFRAAGGSCLISK